EVVVGGIVGGGDTAKGDVRAAHGEVQPSPPQSPQVQPQSPQPQPQPQQNARIPMNLLQEVMDTCTALTKRVKHLEFDKVAQDLEITKLVKKLERRNKGRMIAEMNQDADVVLGDDKEVADEAKEVAEDAKEDETEPAEVQKVQPSPPQSPQVQPQSPQPQPQPQQNARIPMNLLQEVMDTCTALTKRVKHLEFDKVAQDLEITKLVKKLERRNKVRVLQLRRLQKLELHRELKHPMKL
nr:hypothetical protein [Tanacetum cinerariifolium]